MFWGVKTCFLAQKKAKKWKKFSKIFSEKKCSEKKCSLLHFFSVELVILELTTCKYWDSYHCNELCIMPSGHFPSHFPTFFKVTKWTNVTSGTHLHHVRQYFYLNKLVENWSKSVTLVDLSPMQLKIAIFEAQCGTSRSPFLNF